MSDVLAHPAATHTPDDIKRIEAATGRVAVWIQHRVPVLHLLSRDELVGLIEEMELDSDDFGPEAA